jgi:hypothetical protein
MTNPQGPNWPTWQVPDLGQGRPWPSWPATPQPRPVRSPGRRASWQSAWSTAAIVLAVAIIASGLVALGLYIAGLAWLAFSGSMK